MLKNKLSPSMMCCDFFDIGAQVGAFEKNSVELLHIDVMDGEFAPNFALGVDFARQLKKRSSIPLDIHLMVKEPLRHVSIFPVGEGDMVSIHIESTENVRACLDAIKEKGARAFVALNPTTPPKDILPFADVIDGVLIMAVNPGFAGQKMLEGTIEKIGEMRRLLDSWGREDAEIEVDGNVSVENGIKMRGAGANIFVLGTAALFGGDLDKNIGIFRESVCSLVKT